MLNKWEEELENKIYNLTIHLENECDCGSYTVCEDCREQAALDIKFLITQLLSEQRQETRKDIEELRRKENGDYTFIRNKIITQLLSLPSLKE